MSQDPQLPVQIQALLNRLQARLGSGVADAAATLLAAAEEAPARVGREWQLFWQEVELEAERLAQQDSGPGEASDASTASPDVERPRDGGPSSVSSDPQVLIDSLRARVATISHSLDA